MISSLRAYDLRTEYRHGPLGIGAQQPRLSWRLRSDDRGDQQASFRVSVSSRSPQGNTETAWDSGWVASGSSLGIEVGCELASSTHYAWTLWLEDGKGISFRAGTSFFETGLLYSHDFIGAWISRSPHVDVEVDPPEGVDLTARVRNIPPAAHLRREFRVDPGILKATVYASAHGLYELRINSHRVGDHELSPGWTDYSRRVQYQTFDVTDMLRQGENAVGILLADGWWSGYVGFDARRHGNHYGTYPEAWAQILIEYADGTTESVVTDESWRESRGPILYTDLLMGEYRDARKELGGWALPGYDDSLWGPVRARRDGMGTLVSMVDEPIRAIERVLAKTVSTDGNGSHLYDFGQNLVGRVELTLGALADGQRVRFRYGEMLEDGRLYTANLRMAEATDVHVGAKASNNVFKPVFTLHGFRYLEITGIEDAPEPARVTAVVLRNSVPWVGELSTSSADVNQLISNVRWGQRGNFVAVPTDCPQRDERLGWMADAQVFLPTAALNADVASFFTRWLFDVRDAQSVDGSFTDIAPVVGASFADGAPAWGDAGVIIPWHLYRIYGDTRLLAESFSSMRRWVDFIEENNPSLIWTRRTGNNYGDWLQIDAVTPRPVLATAYFARSADLVSRAALELGEAEAHQHYSLLAERIRQSFIEHFVAADATIEGDTQTVYLLAIHFKLLPESSNADLARHLVRTIEAHDGLLTTGFIGVSLLCPVLSAIGRADLAYALLETDRYPSWLYSIRHGATTIWERWDGWTEHGGFQSEEMNSFNHYSLGSVIEWVYKEIAGIDQTPESVAYSHLKVAPKVGGSLTHVEAHFESSRGRIESGWKLDGTTLTMHLTVPPGSTATVCVPSADGKVAERGQPLNQRTHFTNVTTQSGSVSVDIPSGSYIFTSRL